MENILITLGTVVLGWLLGILTPSITRKISDGRERKKLERIILNDLSELKERLAPLPYLVYPKYGKMNKETFEWLRENSSIEFEEGIKKITDSGATIDELISYLNDKGLREKTSSHFKKMNLLSTDSYLTDLGLLDKNLIQKILEIRFFVNALNEEIDYYRDHLKMTFQPGITDTNHKIISGEIDNRSFNIAKQSMHIVDKINQTLEIITAREESN